MNLPVGRVPLSIRKPLYLRDSSKVEKEIMGSPYSELGDLLSCLNETSPRPIGRSIVSNSLETHNKYDLSIIVPVYNSQEFIQQCLDSALNQNTDFDYEVIVIDDGSTDKSADLVDRYRCGHVKVVHQRNGGFSSARNAGIDLASGSYIMFLDSDDVLPSGAVELLMCSAIAEGADVVGAGYWSCNSRGRKLRYHGLKNRLYTKDSKYILLNGFPWGNVYKRTLWNGIRFPVGYYFEDTILPYIIFSRADSIKSVRGCSYYYRSNPLGITATSKYSVKSLDSYWIVLTLLEDLISLGCPLNMRLYIQTLHQFGKLLYSRTINLSSEVIETMFYACCATHACYFKQFYDCDSIDDYWLCQIADALKAWDFNQWRCACKWA